MAWKTISFYCSVSDIVDTLRDNYGYTITNLRKILVDEFEYKSAKDIQEKLNVTSSALYLPFAFRDAYGYSELVKNIGLLLDNYKANNRARYKITCFSLDCGALRQFKAVVVYETLVKLLLNENKLIKYENYNYLP